MNHKAFGLATALAFTVCLLLSGCGKRDSGIEFEGMTFGPDQPGKDNSWGVTRFSLNKRPFLVLINQGGISRSRVTPEGFKGDLYMDDVSLAMDERSVFYTCATSDGIDGAIQIGGHPYDLRQGNVFLLSAKTNPVEVEQLKVDLSQLPDHGVDPEQLRAFKQIDPRVTAAIDAWHTKSVTPN